MSAADAFLSSVESSVGGVPTDFSRFERRAVFVGEDVTEDVSRFGKKVQIGAGLHSHKGNRVTVTQCGVLNFVRPNQYYVQHWNHRYRPHVEDNVIGVVTDVFTESYKVDIRAASAAQLSTLAFDGATKRNRPSLDRGALVFARVSNVHRDMDPELSCVVINGPRKDWTTGESLYGELKGGFVFKVSLGLAERLIDPECAVLLALANGIAFEVAVGRNGMVWVNAESMEEISLIANAIRGSESLDHDETRNLVKSMLKAIA